MNKITFDKYINYRPKTHEHIHFWIFLILYMVSVILIMILSYKYFPRFQELIYNKNDDLIFSLYSTGIFTISMFFVSLLFNFIILVNVFSIIPSIKNGILWYDIASSKTNDYFSYKRKSKRNKVFFVFIIIPALFFTIMSLFVHLNINDSGIYYNKIFEFNAKYYGWEQLKSVSIYPKITTGRRGIKYLSPEMVLEFGENRLDIWDGAGIGSPNSEIIIKVIDMIHRYSTIDIKYDSNFSDDVINLLYNSSTEWKRNNIINVFNYLDKKQ